MKKSLLCRLFISGATLFLSSMAVFPAYAAKISGHLDSVTESSISGWARDKENSDAAVSVELTLMGGDDPEDVAVLSVNTKDNRSDHSFSYAIDWSQYKSASYTVTAAVVSGEERIPLEGFFLYNKETCTASKLEIGPGFEPVNATAAIGQSRSENDSINSGSETAGEYLGSFTASAYCSCDICCAGSTLTYSGTVPQPEHTIAADLDVFPLGTRLWIDGVVYTVEDMGGGIAGNRLDIYFATHEEALDYGLKTVEVYSVKEEK
ncbi:3D domain-containing protein [Lachnospiraceae bacterium 45-P1]